MQVLTDQTLITSPGIKAYKGDVVKQKKVFFQATQLRFLNCLGAHRPDMMWRKSQGCASFRSALVVVEGIVVLRTFQLHGLKQQRL